MSRRGAQDGTEQAAWERAWSERYGVPLDDRRARRPGARGRRAARRSPQRDLLIATALLAVAISSLAIADTGGDADREPTVSAARGEGDPVALGERNPGSGASTRETAIVADAGNGGLVLRPSNTAKGGRAISATCDNDGVTDEDGCAVYVNKGQGAAATFRTQGSVPFAIRETNNGRVAHLNADMLDGVHASDLLPRSEAGSFLGANAKAADSDALDGQDSSAFLGANAKAADSNTLDGKDSSEFLGATAKAADAGTLDGRDSLGFARFAGWVNTAGNRVAGSDFTGQKLGTGNYLVQLPAATVPFDGTDCTVLIPVVTAAGAAPRTAVVERSSCNDSTGAAEFEVNIFDADATPPPEPVDSQFWFIAY